MVAYYYSFKTALVKGSPSVVAANATVLIYDTADTARATPVTAYADVGLTTIKNLVTDQYGIVPDFYTNNRPDILWKSGTFLGQWATSQSRPGITGPQGPQGVQGIQGVQGNPGINGAGTNAEVAAYVTATGATRDALDSRFVGINTLDNLTAAKVADTGSATSVALAARYEIKGGGPGSLQSLQGLYAARPAASSVPSGSLYYATNVQESYRSNGTVWQVQGTGGNELGYAETSTDFTTSAASGAKADITGLSVTFMAGERPIEIMFGGLLVTGGGSTTGYAALVLDGVTKAEAGGTIAGGFQSYQRSRRISGLTPGTMHTFKATLGTASGTITASGASINPAFVSVVNR